MKTAAVHAPSALTHHALAGGPHVMGVLNVTPDSFSDGGKFLNPDKAIEHGLKLISEGAKILDIGGESTRPGAQPIDSAEEIKRVIPVIEGLKNKALWISIDTRNSMTMEAALKAGANAINDISALRHDSRSVSIAAEAKVPVFLMHMKGEPETMQKKPSYKNIIEEIFQFLQARIDYCDTHRIETRMLICDPGIGFGKTLEHNLLILGNISRFKDLGVPILLGASRKSFLTYFANDPQGHSQGGSHIAGSLAAALWGLSQGVDIFRVHDVKETVQAFKTYQAISSSATSPL